MLEVPVKVFNREFENIEIGISRFQFFPKENLDEAQIGYQYDKNRVESKNWIGKEFIVIGEDTGLNDPIIAKVDETQIPIYTMFNKDKTTLEKVADSFEQYMGVLSMIDNADLYRTDKVNDLLDEIEEIVPEKSLYYWEDLINSAHNYLTD